MTYTILHSPVPQKAAAVTKGAVLQFPRDLGKTLSKQNLGPTSLWHAFWEEGEEQDSQKKLLHPVLLGSSGVVGGTAVVTLVERCSVFGFLYCAFGGTPFVLPTEGKAVDGKY